MYLRISDYNSDGKCFSGSDGLDMPYQCPMGENHLYCTVGGYGSGLFRQLRTYDKSEKFLFKMENIPESKKVAVINPQKRIKDRKKDRRLQSVQCLFFLYECLAAHVLLWTLSKTAF